MYCPWRCGIARTQRCRAVCKHQRIAHVYSFTRGQTALEHEPTGKAAAELAALHRWTIDSMIGRSQTMEGSKLSG